MRCAAFLLFLCMCIPTTLLQEGEVGDVAPESRCRAGCGKCARDCTHRVLHSSSGALGFDEPALRLRSPLYHPYSLTSLSVRTSDRIEKIISFWIEGQEVQVEEDGKAAAIHVDQGMSSLVQVKPLVERSRLQPFVCTPLSDRCLPTAQGDVFVEPYARNPALGTVLVSGMGPVTAHGRIESVFRQGQGTTS